MAIVALSLILALTMFVSDRQKSSVEKALARSDTSVVALEQEVKSKEGAIEELRRNYEIEKARLEAVVAETESERQRLHSMKELFEKQIKLSEHKIDELSSQLAEKEKKFERESEQVSVSFAKIQEGIRDSSQRSFRDELSEMEVRLGSLSRNKKLIDDKWTEAMQTLGKMEGAARKMGEAIAADQGGRSELEGVGIAGLSRLKSDIETLRRAMTDTMAVETEMIRLETSKISQKLDTLYSEAQRRVLNNKQVGSSGLEPLAMMVASSDKGADFASLEKRIEDLKLLSVRFNDKDGQAAGTDERQDTAGKPFDIYMVKKGDTLWGIASKENVYGNAFFWPVLYRYNSSRIKSPDVILPEEKILIRRDIKQGDIALSPAAAIDLKINDADYQDDWLKEICAPTR